MRQKDIVLGSHNRAAAKPNLNTDPQVRNWPDANLSLKEQILERTQPTNGVLGRYRPGDQLLNFLRAL